MSEAVMVVMALLAIGFLATRLATLLRLPHSVFLVLLGLATGSLLSASGNAGSVELQHQFPDIILYVLLPPLVFEAAYHLDYASLRRDLIPITALSIGALLLSTGIIGWGLHGWLHIEWIDGLVFGALISATDPVAVVALFREVGAPKRLSILVEGESLLNDGTAIVLFRVLTSPLGDRPLLHATGQFLYVALGGVVVGLGCVLVGRQLLRMTAQSHAAQLGLTVAIAYLSFIVADRYLLVSGVISTMTAGLYLGTRARLELNREALHGMQSLWDFLALSANTLVFLLVGLAVDQQVLLSSLAYIPVTLGVVYIARAVSVIATLEPLNWIGLSQPISRAYQAVLIWGGLRGGLALALALTMPEQFSSKPLFIALATAVVLSTLLINALSIAPTLRALGLDSLNALEEAFYRNSLSLVLDLVFKPLREAGGSGRLSVPLLDNLEQSTRHELMEDTPVPADCGEAFEVQQILLDEQHFYNQRREADALSREAWIVLTRSVGDRLETYRQSGMAALQAWTPEVNLNPGRTSMWQTETRQLRHLAVQLEVLLNLEFGLHEQMARQLQCADPDLRVAWSGQARQKLDELYRLYPHAGVAVQSRFVANTITASAEHALQDLFSADIINGAVHSRAWHRVEKLQRRLLHESEALLHPTLEYLLSHVPLLQDLPPAAHQKLAAAATKRTWAAGSTIVREGDDGDSFFLVLSGLLQLEVRGDVAEDRIRLFPGAFFGEMSLLFGIRRSATIVTVMTSELAELNRDTFETLMLEFPTVGEAVRKSAWDRLAQLEAVRSNASPGAASPG